MSENWNFITAPANSFAGVPIHTNLDTLQANADTSLLSIRMLSTQGWPLVSFSPLQAALLSSRPPTL